jgi:hypothetical protein
MILYHFAYLQTVLYVSNYHGNSNSVLILLTLKQKYYCTDVMYLHLNCSISYGVNL